MLSEKLHELAEEAARECEIDPYAITKYRRFIAYAEKNSLVDSVGVWKCKVRFEAITAADIKRWELAIEREVPESMIAIEKSAMYEMLTQEFPAVNFVLKWFEYSSPNTVQLQKAYAKFQYDYVNGQLIFDLLVENLSSSNDYIALRALYESRLGVPHRQIQRTYEEYSSLISSQFNEDYTKLMRIASKKFRATEDSQWILEKAEQTIAEEPDSPEPWIEYIRQFGLSKNTMGQMLAPPLLLYRSLFSGTCKVKDPRWYGVWLQQLRTIASAETNSELNHTLRQFIKNYPHDSRAYSEAAWMIRSEDNLFSLHKRAFGSGFDKQTGENVNLAKDFMSAHYHLQDRKGSQVTLTSLFIDMVLATCNMFIKTAVVDLGLQMLVSSQDQRSSDAIMKITTRYLAANRESANAWLIVLEAHNQYRYSQQVRSLIREMLSYTEQFCDPLEILEKLDTFVRLHANRNTLFGFHEKLHRILSDHSKRPRSSDEEALEGEPQNMISTSNPQTSKFRMHPESPVSKRVKAEKDDDCPELVRSREQFRVKLYPIDIDMNEGEIRQFFKGYADPLSIYIAKDVNNIHDAFALVELASENDVLSCLTRQFKPLKGLIVNVERVFGATVWVTNYPSKYGIEEIKSMITIFSGKHAVDVRMPSQRDDKERRFFYADFADEETALYVKEKIAGKALEGYELQAEISNPSLKKPKDFDPASHQIHLHNLNFKHTTEETLRTHFSKWGSVTNVYLPVSDANKSKAYHNNGFGFVTFANAASASKALSEKTTQIDGRDVHISIVKPRKHSERSHVGFEEHKTITLKNINSNVTEVQLKDFLEVTIGPVVQISIKPSKQMALVEFHRIIDTGKAGIALDGTEYEDHILHVGSKKDFYREDQALKVPKMMPPMLLRRCKR